MALSRVKTWVAEVLLAADLNAEFNNILNNPVSLISPLTGAINLAGYTLTLDAASVSTLVSSATQFLQLTPGAKSGTPSTTGGIVNLVASTYTDNNTAVSGTAASFAATALQRPTLAATNATVTTTDAATLYIANSPLAGTNETITNAWALLVAAGNTKLAGHLYFTDATYDVGGTATTFRPRDLFLSRNATIGGTLAVTGATTLTTALTVANGGTGSTTATAYAVLCGGTTSTAPHQSVAGLGASGTVLTSNGAGALPTFQAIPAASGTLTAGTALTLNPYAASTVVTQAHGLGAQPTFYAGYMECLTAELGYSINDRIQMSASFQGDTNNSPGAYFSLTSDTTNIVLATTQTLLNIPNKSTGAASGMTAANWKVVITPYKVN